VVAPILPSWLDSGGAVVGRQTQFGFACLLTRTSLN
jgi:hypothetical protein